MLNNCSLSVNAGTHSAGVAAGATRTPFASEAVDDLSSDRRPMRNPLRGAEGEGPAGFEIADLGSVFVGREAELAELGAGLRRAAGGRGESFLIAGEPGVGKTRLADELVQAAQPDEIRFSWGRCWEGGGAPSYWPWTQIARALLSSADGQEALGRLDPEGRVLVEDLAQGGGAATAYVPAPDPERARFRLFDATTRFVRALASARPQGFVFDDLHAADQPSLLLLAFLARELRTTGVFLLGTYREAESHQIPAVSRLLGELARESRHVFLRGLSEPEVALFLQRAKGRAPSSALVTAVYQATDGNPFFLHEVVRLLLASGDGDDPTALTMLRIPGQVREAVRRHLRPLPAEAVALLSAAAVVGRDFEVGVLERLDLTPGSNTPGRLGRDRILDLVGVAIQAGVLGEESLALGRYRFTHALIRETLYDDLPLAERVRLHRAVGETLEELHRFAPDQHPAELAHHFHLAAQGGEVEKAATYLEQAGLRAEGALAYEDAVALYERALQCVRLASTTAAPAGHDRLRERLARARAAVASTEPAPRPVRTPTSAPSSTVASSPNVFRRQGEFWMISYEGHSVSLRDLRGLSLIAYLLRHPDRDCPAVEMAAAGAAVAEATGSGELSSVSFDGGEILDAQARRTYQQRLVDLRPQLSEAESLNDRGRVEVLQREIDFLTQELARAVGLGGRPRRAGSSTERARINVTRAVGVALAKIESHHPALAAHLSRTIRTGTFCSYRPDPRGRVDWEL